MLACHASAWLQTAAMQFAFDDSSVALPLIWFGIIVLTLVVESQTADLVAIWFAPGAFISLILSFFHEQLAARGLQLDIILLWITVALAITAMVVYGIEAIRMLKKKKA